LKTDLYNFEIIDIWRIILQKVKHVKKTRPI